MSVKGTNERTFKDNKNAKENLLKFSTTANIQAGDYGKDNSGGDSGGDGGNKVFKEIMVAKQANVSDFKTEMDKRTEIPSLTSKEVETLESTSHQEARELEIVSCTNCQHLQEQFNNNDNNSINSISSTNTAATMEIIEILGKQVKSIQDSALTHQQTPAAVGDLKDSKKSAIREAPSSFCLHIYMCESPSDSIFYRSSLFWRFCCLCINTLRLFSPALRYIILLICFIFILMFLIFCELISESFVAHEAKSL